ncbi:MAG: hypothetical protein NZQ09_17145, partial [Chloroflexus sp.]|nr:hypothetical protein [Chloroflexus sp.]
DDMSCEQNHLLRARARRAGVAETELDGAWATATISLRQARAVRQARPVRGKPPAADERPLADPDPLLAQRVWGGAGHGGPAETTRRALIAVLRMVEHYRKGSPARLAALRHLLGEPGAPPPSPFWRAMLTGRVPPDLDRARLNPWEAAELLIAGCTHPDLVARAAAAALIARPELARHAELARAVLRHGD